jgi:hypothetical protein
MSIMGGPERIHEVLSPYINRDAIDNGIAVIQKVHQRFADLVNERYERVEPSGPYDDGYSSWYCYRLTPAMQEIGHDGWVERHLWDVSRLATANALGPCCRRTLAETFGVEALHVVIQSLPNSDGMIQEVCHQHPDRVDWLRRLAGQMTMHIVASGNYPPPGLGEPGRTLYRQPGFAAFDARECR